MGAIQVYQYFVGEIDGRPIQGGSLSKARSISLSDDEVIDRTFKVATETTAKVFDKTEDGELGDFNFLFMESDLDVLVQFTTDAGGDDEYFVFELKGSGTSGVMGPALILGSDLAHQFDGDVDVFDGTEDTVDEVWVYNEDTSDTARVHIVIAT